MEGVWFRSPVSKSDATESSGSVSADKQTQVAVWKDRNTQADVTKKRTEPIVARLVSRKYLQYC